MYHDVLLLLLMKGRLRTVCLTDVSIDFVDINLRNSLFSGTTFGEDFPATGFRIVGSRVLGILLVTGIFPCSLHVRGPLLPESEDLDCLLRASCEDIFSELDLTEGNPGRVLPVESALFGKEVLKFGGTS